MVQSRHSSPFRYDNRFLDHIVVCDVLVPEQLTQSYVLNRLYLPNFLNAIKYTALLHSKLHLLLLGFPLIFIDENLQPHVQYAHELYMTSPGQLNYF